MKFTLKTVVLIALLAFYVVIILSNFSSFEGFTSADSSDLQNTVTSGASTVAEPVVSPTPSKSSKPST